eukprot:TRINITY_DN13077_c0_g1_i1.p1 TRINITY_DN13077_c0_g1~~TRINITY_DN13077_c0_g1_i1.p1  ORF type:complete len:110 (-),score=28.86 TRINITY_DN13077_c0_g1_i1:129-458(-)
MLRSLVGSEMCIRDRMKTGQRTMGGVMTTKEQRLVERVLHTPVVRPFISLRITDDELVGQLEEQGVKLGEVDFLEATLKTASSSVSGRVNDRHDAVSYTHLTLPTKRIV